MFTSLGIFAILAIVVIATATTTPIALAIGSSSPSTTATLAPTTKFANNTISKLLTTTITATPTSPLLSQIKPDGSTTTNNTATSTTTDVQPSSPSSLPQVMSAITFGGIKNLSNNAGDSRDPLVDVSGNIVYVVWVDQTTPTGAGDIFFKRSTDGGNTFGTTVNLSNDIGDSAEPRIAKSGSNLYVVWQDYSNHDVFFKRSADNGATFTSTVNLSMDPHSSNQPQIAASGNYVYVVWGDITVGNGTSLDQTRLFFRASNNNGGSFGSVKAISPGVEDISPQIAAAGSNVYIAGQDGAEDNFEIFFIRSTNNGGSFSAPISINNNHEASIFGNIVADGSNVYLVWTDRSIGSSSDVFFRYSTDSGDHFKDIVNLSNNAGESQDPHMRVIGSNVYIAWSDSTGSLGFARDILFKRSINNGADFDSTKNISNNPGDSSNPQISRSGTAVRIVWQDDTFGTQGQDDVLFRASGDNGITFGTIRNLSNNAGGSFDPMIISSGDDMYVVWQDNTSGNWEILFLKGTA